MEVDVSVDPDDINTLAADDRGRVTLGAQYANRDVRLAIIEVADDDSE